MEKVMNKWIGLLFAFSIVLTSCSENRIYETYETISPNGWGMQDSLIYEISSISEKPSQSLIGVRFKDEYPFSNCYIRVLMRDSLKNILQDELIDITLFDPKGEPLGEGFGSTYTKFDTVPLSINEQTASVVLLQYMREEQLKGVEAVGIKLLKE
ncbi:gliding motility lipoprotein GldH [Algoriphagus kandeliae]|uniref:Gliding motility lipoprotein GldH n=1 Tax=Algoriphagus kandeliae TaxID=2562278 RepID=A0A4Y9QQI9_9BACT|nr:gliding motility lipoprotein GldH [Algoriphagus kandeliae]TFV93135.1 gliding motility lipoprotein GldH [Algoriphagus kandeliae]